MANPPAIKKAAQQEPKMHFIQKVIGSDTYMVMADSATHVEDEFSNLYYTATEKSKVVLMPPYEPKVLANLVTKNNILSQCVEAMEVNIDGTGHSFVPLEEGGTMPEAELTLVKDFFEEPYPGISFLTMRRKMRRDLESIGYAALEVLRNIEGEVVSLRNLDTYSLRFIKLDEAILVEKTIQRSGSEAKFNVMERERRFMQRLGNRYIYYREFGTSRDCNKDTGAWAAEGEVLDPTVRATELLMFEVNPDIASPYGVPRWINQLPSVIGSRKAEEQNLEYFDAGGLPPAIIFIQGGTLAKDASDQLRNYLSGKNKNKNRAVIVEAQSSSGSLESAGSVQVKVERFGAEKANDSMYSAYDKNAEEHVRIGFRLPPLFLGKAADYNYATAVVAYMVAEEQVFQPERAEFDEKINKSILKVLGIKGLKYKSLPITLKNIDAQLKALELIGDKVEQKGLIDEVNKITGTELKYEKQPDPIAPANPNVPDPLANEKPILADVKPLFGKSKTAMDIVELAAAYVTDKGLLNTTTKASKEDLADLEESIATLTTADRASFNQIVAAYIFKDDDTSLVHLTGCNHGAN